jgi:nitrile hydratase accessory protein
MPDALDIDADLDGPVSPPRDNGEIVFAAPWERRVFGLAVAACRSDACDWESFRQRLIARIGADAQRPYWQCWAAALEDVLCRAAVLAPGEVDARSDELALRPAGFDHRH